VSRENGMLRDARRERRYLHVGRVTVYPRGASWHLYYREGGKVVRVRIGPDRDEAERRAAEVNGQLANGAPSVFGFEKVTVEDLRKLWLEHHDLVLRSSPATMKRYRTASAHLVKFLRERHPGVTADAFTPRIAEELVKYLRQTAVALNGHSSKRQRRLMDKGVVYILCTCRSLFNYAKKRRHLPPYAENPFAELGIERMKIEDTLPKTLLSRAEEVAFLEACNPWQFRVFAIMAFTGMRSGELSHLLIEDVDFTSRVLHIRNHPELGWRTKTRNELRIFLTDDLLAVVRDAAGNRKHGPLILARKFAGGQALPPLAGLSTGELAKEFTGYMAAPVESSGPMSARERTAEQIDRFWRDLGATHHKKIRLEFIRVAKRIGRRDLSCPKLWRHQMATAMQEADVDPFARKEIIGHTRLETTGIYTHTSLAVLGQQMAKVERLRGEALGVVKRRLG
jgi:integrase